MNCYDFSSSPSISKPETCCDDLQDFTVGKVKSVDAFTKVKEMAAISGLRKLACGVTKARVVYPTAKVLSSLLHEDKLILLRVK